MSEFTDQAIAAYNQGHLARAGQLAAQALSQDPGDTEATGIAGLVAANRQDIRKACELLREAIERGATQDELPGALAYCYARLNGPDAMLKHLSALLKSRPRFTALRLELLQLLYRSERFADELALAEEGINAGDVAPELLLYYGRALLNNDRASEAIEKIRLYTEQRPQSADGFYFLGAALRSVGSMTEAREVHLKAMKIQPFHPGSFYSYVRSGRIKQGDPLVSRFDELSVLQRTASDNDASFYHYGKGKAFEDLGDYDQAFKEYRRGGARLAKQASYNRAETEGRIAALKSFFSAERLGALAGQGIPDAQPIFIVGMPRSGSTLTEQILAGHRDVAALGELLDFERLCRPALDGIWAGGSPVVDWLEIGSRYLQGVEARAPQPDVRIVDKGLHNFMLIGFLHTTFPNATILHCVRDPLDTCFSCFSLRFARGHEWSNRLADVAHYYRYYRDLMAHWEKVLPGCVTEVRYERLAEDFEPEVRRLLEVCDLPWDPECLTFYETERAVRTASSAQVRQPVTTSSIGRWRHFETYLADLKDALSDLL